MILYIGNNGIHLFFLGQVERAKRSLVEIHGYLLEERVQARVKVETA